MLELRKNPSLASADTLEAVQAIILKKAEQYEGNEAKLVDYIAKAFNVLTDKKNEAIIAKCEAERHLKRLNTLEDDLKVNIANVFKSLGFDKLSDKSSDIGSSITITEETEETGELKEVALTFAELKDKCKLAGVSITKLENVKKEKKPNNITVRYKRGKKIKELKPKEAVEQINKRLEEIE